MTTHNTQMSKIYFDDQLIELIKLGRNDEALSIIAQDDDIYYMTDDKKSTLLHHAAKYGNTDLVQNLIDMEINVDAANCNGETPLMLALRGLHEETVKVLLSASADPFVADMHSDRELRKAFYMHRMKVIFGKALLNKATPASLSKCQYVNSKVFHQHYPLYHFVSLKNVEVIKVLLEKGSPVNASEPKTKITALHLAVKELDVETVKLLVENHADVNARDYMSKNALYYISDFFSKPLQSDLDYALVLEIVKVLINAGAAVIDYNSSYIMVSSILSKGNRELIRTVLPGLNLHFYDRAYECTPLDYLFSNHNPGVFEELQHLKFDVNSRCRKGKTPLHHAARKFNTDAVKFLIKRGADINAKDNRKLTPLYMAIDPNASTKDWNIRNDCIYTLLENGADPHILTKDNYGHNLLFRIAWDSMFNYVLDLISPVLEYLALQEASGQEIDPFMLAEIERRWYYKDILITSRWRIKEMKQIKIDEGVTLFDFLTVGNVSLYAHNETIISNLTSMKDNEFTGCYYYSLQRKFLKCTQLIAINDTFVQHYNVSVINVAEKILNYL